MRIREIKPVLRAAVEQREPVLIVGEPGVGKSATVAQVAEELGYDLLVDTPAIRKPTDATGYPWIAASGDHARHVPYADLLRVLRAERPTIWFLDDLAQAKPAVQTAYMPWVLDRRCGEHRLPPSVAIIAATNDVDHGAECSVLEPLKDRFTVLQAEFNLDDWLDWAVKRGIHEAILGFAGAFPTEICAWRRTPMIREKSPTPRGWERVHRWLQVLPTTSPALKPTVTGCVGALAAERFIAFLQAREALPDIRQWIEDPTSVTVPTDVSLQYAAAAGVAGYAAAGVERAIIEIAIRFAEAGYSEVAVYCLRNAMRRDPRMLSRDTAATDRLRESSLGQDILAV